MTLSDSELQQNVLEELDWNPLVDASHIGVAADDGVVTLSGIVHSFAQKDAAEKAVRRVKGVKAIALDLTVRLSNQRQNSDTEIAGRIHRLFEWNSLVPHDAITAKVEDGYVSLTGTVDWYYQSKAARDAVAKISGITGIRNDIVIRTGAKVAEVRTRVQDAIRRQAAVDANSIVVTTEGSKVNLSGRVHSWQERRVAEDAAWGAPGITQVVDNIAIVN